MFNLFIVLLSFSSSLATKRLFLNHKPCMVRPTLIDLNPVAHKYYPFMISLNKCTVSCNALPPKICVSKEIKYVSVKTFNMITNKNDTKTMTEHISCDCKWNLNSTICKSNQKLDNKTCQCECKKYCTCKKGYGWNPSTFIFENSKYSKSITDTPVTECDEIKIVMDNVSTKKTNTIARNAMSTASINCHSMKVRECYNFHTVPLAIILSLITIIICYDYAKQKGTI